MYKRTVTMSRLCLSLRVLLLCVCVRARQLPGSCSFELDTCGYSSDPNYGSWTVNKEGHLISVDSSLLDEQEQAILVSPILDEQDWSCVRLVYQISGGGSLQLYLRLASDNFDYLLWTANKASDSWLIASVDLPNNAIPYQILLEGRPAGGLGKSVAIFEIHIVNGYCIECDFEEHHMCGYSNSWNPNVNWYVGGVATESNLFGNNTTNNYRGHFVKQERGNIFSVFTRDQLGVFEEIWRPEVIVTAGWTLVYIEIKAPHPLQVVFEVAFNSARGGYVAIDDISFSPEFCQTDTESTFDPAIANCDFDNGLCLYYQEKAESKVWSRVSIKPNTYRIGDHTTGTGYFLLANTGFTSIPGYVGRLHGPFLPGNHKYCLRFYYLLNEFRKVDSTLVLYIYDENNVAQEKVWSLSDTPRAVWTVVEITYMKPMLSKIVFATICNNFWECGSLAIDDITVSLGDCKITAGSVPGQCNFESGVCGYIQDKKGDNADWLRMRGHTPTSLTGPRGDHSTGVGYFIYIEASLMHPGHKARLLTSYLHGSSSVQCLIFYYHMYGSGTGILNVFLAHGRRKDILLWRSSGELSITWMRATVDYHCHVQHQIIFEAIRGPSLRSDIAIDDIHFKRGPCEEPGEASPYSGSSEYFNEVVN
ncbi:MAM domain-containing protein 2a isoform X2 [Parambassis ranga]|uniref:MAM domain-containing protein 2a isoform X2 n=1 Tax=Parambassis ranga TaxID=210632 RepID=A0A6P7J1P7_9TELE|nr:MAM domain-containing protein 2 isoform X2 [Parambassis ranga]